MIFSLKEVFSNEEKSYYIGITFEEGSYNDFDFHSKRKGWIVPYFEGDILDVKYLADKYKILPRKEDDSRTYWESDEPVEDKMVGLETYYTMFIKNLDGSDVSKEDFDRINNTFLMDDSQLYNI